VSLFARIEAMRDELLGHRWADLESAAARDCLALDPSTAEGVARVNLGSYEAELANGLRAVLANVRDGGFRAVYWEFDPDNEWSSAFFPCWTYAPEANKDDDWASDFDTSATVPGPALPHFADIYEPAWDATPEAAARNGYLIARTLAAFGRAADAVWTEPIPLCAGYHDQDVVFRIVASE
jgi:hypothetical protein